MSIPNSRSVCLRSLSLLLVVVTGCQLGPANLGELGSTGDGLTRSTCEGLDQASCLASAECEVIPGVCPMLFCQGTTECPECNPYGGCRVKAPVAPPNRCDGLDEATCTATIGCRALYLDDDNCTAPSSGLAWPPETRIYKGCVEDGISVDGGVGYAGGAGSAAP